jgi:hypothetical protein
MQFHCASYGVVVIVKCSCSPAGAAPLTLGGRGSVPLPGSSGMVVILMFFFRCGCYGPSLRLAPSLLASSTTIGTKSFFEDIGDGNRSFISHFVWLLCVLSCKLF